VEKYIFMGFFDIFACLNKLYRTDLNITVCDNKQLLICNMICQEIAIENLIKIHMFNIISVANLQA